MKIGNILMSGPMVRATLRDVDPKTQTRRIAKLQPIEPELLRIVGNDWKVHYTRPVGHPDIEEAYNTPGYSVMTCREWVEFQGCQYGQPGDRLWVKETWAAHNHYDGRRPLDIPEGVTIECREVPDAVTTEGNGHREIRTGERGRWRPSIFMRRWMSRITLELESVRVERLQEISEADAIAEGIEPTPFADGSPAWRDYSNTGSPFEDPRQSYRTLWESINGPGSWAKNPFVWVLTFRRLAYAETARNQAEPVAQRQLTKGLTPTE